MIAVGIDFSRKVTVLSILAMLAVVFIHSTAYLTMAHPAAWNVFAAAWLANRFFPRGYGMVCGGRS